MPPTTEKPSKICIRGLPLDTDQRKLQKDLRELGFDPIFIRHVPARDKGPGIFCVQLQDNPKLSVYDIKKLQGVPVRVEAWRGRKGPPQCHRCQGFQHSTAECLREHRCVHCARPHPSQNCNRPYDIPTCANCAGPHEANDLSCPAIRREEIARAGKVLRTSGYTLETPKPVADINAPTSLMAMANTSWRSSLRRRRRKNAKENRLLLLHERPQSQLERSEVQSVATVMTKPELKTQDTPILVEPNKPKPVSKIVQEALSKSINIKESQKESLQNKSDIIVQDKSQIPPQCVQKVVLINEKSQSTEQQVQQTSTQLTKMEQTRQTESPAKPTILEQPKSTVQITCPDPVRTKVLTDCVLVLQSVLSAIQAGDNPVPIILEGIADLCRGA